MTFFNSCLEKFINSTNDTFKRNKLLPIESDSDLKNDSISGAPFEQGLICDVL